LPSPVKRFDIAFAEFEILRKAWRIRTAVSWSTAPNSDRAETGQVNLIASRNSRGIRHAD
jgi:hypothetical protein